MDIFKKSLREIAMILYDVLLILIYLFRPSIDKDEFLFLSGSDSTHFNSLVNLLNSLNKFEKETEVIVINLGLSIDEMKYLKENFKYKIKDFDFANNPDFVSVRDDDNKLGSYAWKPISIYEEFKNTSKNVLWLDAGCLINKKLSLLKIIIKKMVFTLLRVQTILKNGLMSRH